jgi:hypothetical protein
MVISHSFSSAHKILKKGIAWVVLEATESLGSQTTTALLPVARSPPGWMPQQLNDFALDKFSSA